MLASIETCLFAELFGPLNDVEEKYAPKQIHFSGRKGLLTCERTRVSIVGSRKASVEGLRRAAKLAAILSCKQMIVVSGLAEGIDTAGHTGAIDRGGDTIAVIGTPLDTCYPRQNQSLQERIMREHLVISQFNTGTKIQRKNFPIRNRTMALISDATVIVEAKDGSGSLHQGWEALRLGRPLFIMESAANDTSLKWPNELIKYGAQILSSRTAEELLEDVPTRPNGELEALLV